MKNNSTGEMFHINTRTNLATTNCVYLIICAICEMKYVGETGNTLACRFYQYKHNVLKQQNKHLLVIKHFIEHGWSALRVMILESEASWSQQQRRRAEARWMEKLDTRAPRGLNEKTCKKRRKGKTEPQP